MRAFATLVSRGLLAARQRPRKARQLRPVVEGCEGRLLLSHAPAPAAVWQVDSAVSPLSRYTVFLAQVRRGPHAGLTIVGPIVLGQTDARGQVIGFVFQQDGPRLTAVGGVFGRRVALRLGLRDGSALELSGVGQLRRVPGGLPGGMALVGSGILSGPGKDDSGIWLTVRPTPVA